MDRSVLAARIQDILKGRPKPAGPEAAPRDPAGQPDEAVPPRRGLVEGGPVAGCLDEEAAFAARCAADEASSSVTEVLGGRVVETAAGRSLVVEHCFAPDHVHGRHRVEKYCSSVDAALSALPLFLRDNRGPSPAPSPGTPLFFDLETTGLSGGAGTYAFLVGCGCFEEGGFRTRQFFLRGYGEERALLEAVREFVQQELLTLVTYNGKAFDLPLIETRYLFHRRTSPFASLPHVDMLFAARRLWKRRASRAGVGREAVVPPGVFSSVSADDLHASCALTALEQDILGLQRHDDVPGWEIPARYFGYTRTGDARGLLAVLEHNRLDLLSLAAITSLILEMVGEQDARARDRHECLSLARLLEYLDRESDAERCYQRAAAADGLFEREWDRRARAEALHWLALHRRRAHRFPEAAEAWRQLLEIPGIAPDLRREACEALAVHHEHRAKDLAAARSFALRALDVARGGRFAPDVEHRLDRLSRKLGTPRNFDDGQSTLPVD